MAELVMVRARDCACPDTPHEEGDFVYLLPILGIEGGMAAELDLQAVQTFPPDRRGQALFARWFGTFLRYGAVGWNLTEKDDKGRTVPRPFDVDVLTSSYADWRDVAERANDLYSEAVMRPLLERAEAREAKETPPTEPSPTGPTDGSTSPAGRSTRKPRRSSSPPASVGQQSVTSP